MRRFVLVALAGAAILFAAPAMAATHDFEVKVLSSPPEMVTGGDALVQVSIPKNVPPKKATVSLNGTDVTGELVLDAGRRTLTGLLTGLRLGDNALHVD